MQFARIKLVAVALVAGVSLTGCAYDMYGDPYGYGYPYSGVSIGVGYGGGYGGYYGAYGYSPYGYGYDPRGDDRGPGWRSPEHGVFPPATKLPVKVFTRLADDWLSVADPSG